jgi:hypothetical protein
VPRLVSALSLQVLDLAHDALAVDDLAVDYVLLVEMGCGNGGNEELRAVCACLMLVDVAQDPASVGLTRSRVGHAQQEWLVVDLLEVLVFELLAVDALTTRAVAFCEISALNHEALDNTVEARPLVVQRLASLADAFLARA